MVGRHGVQNHERWTLGSLRSRKACPNSFEVDQVWPRRDEDDVSHPGGLLGGTVGVRGGVDDRDDPVLFGGARQGRGQPWRMGVDYIRRRRIASGAPFSRRSLRVQVEEDGLIPSL